MDIQEYILSGAIESYVLGLASANEINELQTLSDAHSEVKLAISSFEKALERQALANAVLPPSTLKVLVMQALAKEGMNITNGAISISKSNSQSAQTISLTSAPKSIRWMRGAIAASVLLILGSSILNFYLYSQYKKYSDQYADLLEEEKSLLAKNISLQTNFNAIKDTAILPVQMKAASPLGTGSMATVMWNKQSTDVYLIVNNLPPHATDRQYQLWAIVDGKPVDAGMIDISKNEFGLIKMAKISNAQAFAITLEKKGGSPTPDMTQLFVLGKVS